MKSFLRLPSPAMAVAFTALLLALVGTAVALPGSNNVFKDDIATNAVGKSEIRTGAVGKLEARRDSVGKVELREEGDRDGGLTGAYINESSLGTVPNADRVDGHHVARLNYRAQAGTTTQVPLSIGGLVVNATCGVNALTATATTAFNNAMAHVGTIEGIGTPQARYDQDADLDIGQNVQLLPGGNPGNDQVQGTLTYAAPGGSTVSLSYLAERQTNALQSANDCFLIGTATQSG
jgi:hypothetical protein